MGTSGDVRPRARSLAILVPWICVALHIAALVAFATVLAPGSEAHPDLEGRARHVREYTGRWQVGWTIWMASALSLIGFYAWWGSRIRARCWALIAIVVAAVGSFCDLVGEGIYAFVLPDLARPESLREFLAWQRAGTLWTAGAANGLYTIAGIVLTIATSELPRGILAAMWTTWSAGVAMSVCAILDETTGLVISSAVVFPLFILWVSWMGWRHR